MNAYAVLVWLILMQKNISLCTVAAEVKGKLIVSGTLVGDGTRSLAAFLQAAEGAEASAYNGMISRQLGLQVGPQHGSGYLI